MHFLKLIFFLFICGSCMAQNGGTYTFNFMQFSNAARLEALGGYTLALDDEDASLGVSNPACLDTKHHGQLNLNYVNYFADSDYGFSSYVHHLKNIGTLSASVFYANYGKFQYADVSGDRDGSNFTANDIMLQVGLGRELKSKFRIGGNIKLAASFLESYNAFAVGLDLAFSYQDPEKKFGAGLLVRNIGYQLKGYTKGIHEPLPFSIDIGISKQLGHAPFRFSFTYHDLQRWDIIYFDLNAQQEYDPLTGQQTEVKEPGIITHFFNHIVIGTELLLSKNFHIRCGFDFKTRYEMKPDSRPGTTGFSWGVGFKIKRFKLSYAISKYHLSGTSNHLTIATQIGGKPKVDDFYRQH